MSRKLILSIVITFIVSIAIVMVLYAISTDIRETLGSFLRTYPPHPAVEVASVKIKHDSYYFAGATHDRIYLAHRKAPLHVLGICSDLSDTVHIALKIDDLKKHKNFQVDVRIDSPCFYFMDGTVPYLYRGDLVSWQGKNILADSIYFLNAVPISATAVSIAAYSRSTRENELGKKVFTKPGATLNNDLLQKQLDGSFCVDGSLQFNKKLNKLVYLYYYRNEYFVMDTNLNLEYRAHTIDTFSRAQVKFDTIHATGVVKLSAPPLTINKRFAMSDQWLFIHSRVAARNEFMDQFHAGAVMDVYNLNEHKYAFSFYIMDANGEKLRDLFISGNRLYALFDHTLKRYDLMPRYFAPGMQ